MVEGGRQDRDQGPGVASLAHGREAYRRPRITLVQTTVPHYRIQLFDALATTFGEGFSLLAGADYFDRTVTRAPMPGTKTGVISVWNRFLARRTLLWQSGVWRRSLAADVFIGELNPRVLSTWAVLLSRRLLHRPTILWGHAWPRRGEESRSDLVRHAMRRLADAIVVYSEVQARQLRARMPDRLIVAAPNALYPRSEHDPSLDHGRRRDFLFVGRLIPAKKPELLLGAFLLVLDDLPADTNLVFVGEGPLRDQLTKAAERSPARRRIRFLGEVSDRDRLGPLFGDALASVVPGYAGLSLIQSLWFGVPVIVARDEPHSPEIAAVVPGQNALFFPSDSERALAAALVDAANDRDAWIGRRETIARECAESYAIDSMVDAMAAVVEEVRA